MAVVALAVLLGGWRWISRMDLVETDDAYVDGRVYTITPRVAGYVAEVPVEENQAVKKGDVLARLDPVEYEVALAEARSALAALGEDATAADQELRLAEAENNQANLDLKRTEGLLATQAVSQSAVDLARTKAATTHARMRAAQAKLDAIHRREGQSHTGVTQALGTLRDTLIEAKRALVKQAELNLSYTQVAAPADGFVTKKMAEPGLMVARGQPLMSIVPLDISELYVTANFKETDLTKVKPGQPVDIRVDTFPGVVVKGRVESIQAGTGSVFSLFPPENASGNFVKVVQRIPVRIAFEPGQNLPGLRVGMSVVPTIDTGR